MRAHIVIRSRGLLRAVLVGFLFAYGLSADDSYADEPDTARAGGASLVSPALPVFAPVASSVPVTAKRLPTPEPDTPSAPASNRRAAPIETTPENRPASERACGQLGDTLATRLSLARQTLDSGKGYAALAYLDAVDSHSPEAQLIRADANRRIGRLPEAEVIYQQLAGGCLAGHAFRGLGLIESGRKRLSLAVAYLEKAQRLLPLFAALRNDLGYLYMEAGNYPAARFAFMTAIELDPADRRPLHNLIVTLARQGDAPGARKLAVEAGVAETDLTSLLGRGVALAPVLGEPYERPQP
jgi:Flp pilus assembly protein TadD